MEWLVWIGVGSLLTYEVLAALTGWAHTISEWFWRAFRKRPWTRWLVLATLVLFTLHIVGELWGYSTGLKEGPPIDNTGSVYRGPVAGPAECSPLSGPTDQAWVECDEPVD